MAQAQGALSQILMQMEPSYNTAPTAVQTKKVYFSQESLIFSRSMEQSKVIRGSSRHPTRGIAGSVDVAGGITTELQATTPLWYAALGDCVITAGTPTVGSALAAATISNYDWVNQILTVSQTSHGLLCGDTVQIIATAPTILNGTFYFPVIDRVSADVFKIRVGAGGSGTASITSIKPCTVGTFTYTFKAGGKLPSYTIEKGFPDIAKYFKYTGVCCSKLGFDLKPSGILDMTSDWMGAQETVGTSSFETGTTKDAGKFPFDASKLAVADAKEGGSQSAIIKSCSFSLDNSLDGDTFLLGGGGVRGGINPGVYQITGSLSAVFQDTALYDKAKASTESSLDFTFKNGTGAGTLGNESLQIVVPELIFTAKAPAVSGAGGVLISLDFTGDYTDGADATALKVVIKCPTLPGSMI